MLSICLIRKEAAAGLRCSRTGDAREGQPARLQRKSEAALMVTFLMIVAQSGGIQCTRDTFTFARQYILFYFVMSDPLACTWINGHAWIVAHTAQ